MRGDITAAERTRRLARTASPSWDRPTGASVEVWVELCGGRAYGGVYFYRHSDGRGRRAGVVPFELPVGRDRLSGMPMGLAAGYLLRAIADQLDP